MIRNFKSPIRWALVSITLFVFISAKSQGSITYDSAMVVINKVVRRYQTDTLQRMNVYSNLYLSDDPTVKVDSMVGSYYIKGKSILASLDNAVFLRNDRWSVNIFNDTQEIYLDSVENDSQLNLKGNPLQMVDSTNYDPAYSYELTNNNDTSVLQIQFNSGGQVNKAVLVFSKSTSRMMFAQYEIPAYKEEELEPTKNYILQMLFEEPFIDESAGNIFNERKYFTFDNYMHPHGFGAFKDYKIITAFDLPATSLP